MRTEEYPLVSVLIPTYNRAIYLDECLYSLAVQDYPNYEVLIRDNDSTDDTAAVVKKNEPQFAHIVEFRYKKNETNVGFRDNFIHGVAECKGKYTIILMDDDFLCSPTAISSFAKALEATAKTSLVVAPTEHYRQGRMDLSPKQIVDGGSRRTSCSQFSTISGEEYFLNSWTKYGPLCFSSSMFNTQLALQSPWATWTRKASLDINLYHAISLNQNVAIIKEPLAFYRVHGAQDFHTAPLEDKLDGHTRIDLWYAFAKQHAHSSRLSLFVWLLKTLMLREEGVIRDLADRDPWFLEQFLRWLKGYDYLHYLVLRYLSPQMRKYDYREAARTKRGLSRARCEMSIWLRRRIASLVLYLDRAMHDSQASSLDNSCSHTQDRNAGQLALPSQEGSSGR